MARNVTHDLLATPNAEEASRQRYILSLKRFLNSQWRPNNTALHTAQSDGETPQSREAARAALFEHLPYRLWSAANRASQELMWLSIGEMTLRQEDKIQSAFKQVTSEARNKRGSLTLTPSLDGPSVKALNAVNVHLQPGGYLLDRDPGDILAGALYEAGGNLYSFGQGMGAKDSKAQCVMRYLRDKHALESPARILDLGCSAGAASCEYALGFPSARVDAIDLGAGLLRYAHGRAEALEAAVHFSQMDAAHLAFEDDSFDLVVSHNLLHEISAATRAVMFTEIRRVLKPGGLCVMQDVPMRLGDLPVMEQAEKTWDIRYNGELFWEDFADADLIADFAQAGFAPDHCGEEMLPKIDGPGGWYAIIAQK